MLPVFTSLFILTELAEDIQYPLTATAHSLPCPVSKSCEARRADAVKVLLDEKKALVGKIGAAVEVLEKQLEAAKKHSNGKLGERKILAQLTTALAQEKTAMKSAA